MNTQAEITQPYSAHELYLFECERALRASEWYECMTVSAPFSKKYTILVKGTARAYEVTRNGFTMLWNEVLVRYFLNKHAYRNPDSWLECFGRDGGTWTDFGWVKEHKG